MFSSSYVKSFRLFGLTHSKQTFLAITNSYLALWSFPEQLDTFYFEIEVKQKKRANRLASQIDLVKN